MRGLGLFSIRGLFLVFVMLGLAAPALAGNMLPNGKSFAAAHNATAGLEAAAQVVSAQSEQEDVFNQAAVDMPISGCLLYTSPSPRD